jgi:hypothetical protein
MGEKKPASHAHPNCVMLETSPNTVWFCRVMLARPSSNSPDTTRNVASYSYIQKCMCTRHKILEHCVYPSLGSSHPEDVGSVAYVSVVHAASIFRVEVQPFLVEMVVSIVFLCLRPQLAQTTYQRPHHPPPRGSVGTKFIRTLTITLPLQFDHEYRNTRYFRNVANIAT